MERPVPIRKARDTPVDRVRTAAQSRIRMRAAVKNVRFIGLDVLAQTIAVAVAEVGGEVHSVGVIRNRAKSVSRQIKKSGKAGQLRVCYETGPLGTCCIGS